MAQFCLQNWPKYLPWEIDVYIKTAGTEQMDICTSTWNGERWGQGEYG